MITGIEISYGRAHIYFDGVCRLIVRERDVKQAKIHEGVEMTPDECEVLLEKLQYNACYEAALCLLDVSSQTQKGISEKLMRKGFVERAAKRVTEKLKESHLIDDSGYADRMLLSGIASNTGKNVLRRKMIQKGIDPETVDAMMDRISGEQQVDACKQAYLSAARKYSKEPDPYKRKQKIAGCLVRKGFSWDICKDVMEESEAEQED